MEEQKRGVAEQEIAALVRPIEEIAKGLTELTNLAYSPDYDGRGPKVRDEAKELYREIKAYVFRRFKEEGLLIREARRIIQCLELDIDFQKID